MRYWPVRSDDRTYLIQLVGALTGLSQADAERRADKAIASAQTSIARSRRSTIVLPFSVATAVLLGAVAAWAAACAADDTGTGQFSPTAATSARHVCASECRGRRPTLHVSQ